MLERRIAGMAAECEELRSERDAAVPRPGLPNAVQEGEPLDEIAPMSKAPIEVMDRGDECPTESFAVVRAQAGTSCATYTAEVSAWMTWCIPDCDRAALSLRVVELAAGACVDFCSSKGCGARVTFIPPPNGCTVHNCYDTAPCAAECRWREYCSLIDTMRVWNCFCQDLVPT
jgi:hypothetical protein